MRRVIYNPKGKKEISYAWGVGVVTNNQVELPTLWQGLKIMKSKGIRTTLIIGDSKLIISQINKKDQVTDANNISWIRLQKEEAQFEKSEYYHMLGQNIIEVDNKSNEGVQKDYGQLEINGEITVSYPP